MLPACRGSCCESLIGESASVIGHDREEPRRIELDEVVKDGFRRATDAEVADHFEPAIDHGDALVGASPPFIEREPRREQGVLRSRLGLPAGSGDERHRRRVEGVQGADRVQRSELGGRWRLEVDQSGARD